MAKAKQPKRSIYRVMHNDYGWYWKKDSTPPTRTMQLYVNKVRAVAGAISVAKQNQPSQVLVYTKSRATGRYRIVAERSYGTRITGRDSD